MSPSLTPKSGGSLPADEDSLEVCATRPQLAEDTTGVSDEIATAGQKVAKTLRTNRVLSEGSTFPFSRRPGLARLSGVLFFVFLFSEISGFILNSDHRILNPAGICRLFAFPGPGWGELWQLPRWSIL